MKLISPNVKQLILIDSRISLSDRERLIDGLAADGAWYVLDTVQSGLAQVRELVSGYSNLSSLQIVSYGGPGSLLLGSGALDIHTLNQNAGDLARIGESLSSTGDILLYGCNVAQGEAGQAFIQKLAAVTGADVAASTNLSGAQGDWMLEASTGPIEAAPLNIPAFTEVLDVPVVTPQRTASTKPTITGQVNVPSGKALEVTLAGKVYKVGDGSLTLSGSTWTLDLSQGQDLALGTYNVTARLVDQRPTAAVVTGASASIVGSVGNPVNLLSSSSTASKTLTGASKSDVAVYNGNASDYTVASTASGVTVTKISTGVVDTLININQIKFNDGQVFVAAAAQRSAATGVEANHVIAVNASGVFNGTKAAETFVVSKNVSALVMAGDKDIVDLSGATTDYTFSSRGSQLQISDGAFVTTVNLGGNVTIRTASGSYQATCSYSTGSPVVKFGTKTVAATGFDSTKALAFSTTTSSNVSAVVANTSNDDLVIVAPGVNVNNPATGSVSISGNLMQGELLTASNTLADTDGVGSLSYQWYADGVAIGNATASTYRLTEAQVGKAITVRASFLDGKYNTESKISNPSIAVANLNDAPTGGPSLTGTAKELQTLTAGPGSLADADGLGTLSYQWYRDGVPIVGANATTYTLTSADVGHAIRAKASYVDGHGTSESVATAPSSLVLSQPTVGTIAIHGVRQSYTNLEVDTTGLSDFAGATNVSYTWYDNGHRMYTPATTTFNLNTAAVYYAWGNRGNPGWLCPYAFNPSQIINDKFTVELRYTNIAGEQKLVSANLDPAPGVLGATIAQALSFGGVPHLNVVDNLDNLLALADQLASNPNAVKNIIDTVQLSGNYTVPVSVIYKLNNLITALGEWFPCYYTARAFFAPNSSISVSDSLSNIMGTVTGGDSSKAMPMMILPTNVTINSGGAVSAADLYTAMKEFNQLKVAPGTVLNVTVPDEFLDPNNADKLRAVQSLVTSNSASTVAPVLQSITTMANSKYIVLHYDMSMGTVAASNFDVRINGTKVTPSAVFPNGTDLDLGFANAFTPGQTVTVAYTPPTSAKLANVFGTAAAAIGTTTVTVDADTAAPFISGNITTSADGSQITIPFDKELSSTTALPSAFTVQDQVSAMFYQQFFAFYFTPTWSPYTYTHKVTNVSVQGTNLVLTLDTPIMSMRDKVFISYQDPTPGNDTFAIQGINNADARGFNNTKVVNNIAFKTITGAGFGVPGDNITLPSGTDNYEVYAREEGDTIIGNDGNNLLDAGFYKNSNFTSTDFMVQAYSMTGESVGKNNNTVYAGNGSNQIFGDYRNDWLQGGTGNDLIFGFTGNDIIIGGGGKNVLIGNVFMGTSGPYVADNYVFYEKAALNPNVNFDTILNFGPGHSVIALSPQIFQGLDGSYRYFLDQAQLLTYDYQRILYDQNTGTLSYDPDGVGPQAAIPFALISNKAKLTAADFAVVDLQHNTGTPLVSTINGTAITNISSGATVSSGGTTRVDSIVLGGTADAGDLVQILDGTTPIGYATLIGSNWSFLTPTLASGSHSFTAKVSSFTGETKTSSAFTVTISTTLPISSNRLLSYGATNGYTTSAALSPQGYVAVDSIVSSIANVATLGNFTDSNATGLDLVVMNSATSVQELASHSSAAGGTVSAGVGAPASSGTTASTAVYNNAIAALTYNGISANGDTVVFTNNSNAGGFGNNGTAFQEYSGYQTANWADTQDLMAYNVATGNLTMLTHNATGSAVTSNATYKAITADGQYVIYSSGFIGAYGDNGIAFGPSGSNYLIVANAINGHLAIASHSAFSLNQGSAATYLGVSADSQYMVFSAANAAKFGNNGVAFSDTNTTGTGVDLFSYRFSDGNISLLSHGSSKRASAADNALQYQGISSDGHTAFFTTSNAALYGFTDAYSGNNDIIAVSCLTGDYQLVSHSAAGNTVAGPSNSAFVGTSGSYVYFTTSDSTVLGADRDGGSGSDLWRYDMSSGNSSLMSHTNVTTELDGLGAGVISSIAPLADFSQRYVAYTSNIASTSNLGNFSLATAGNYAFLTDTRTGQVSLINHKVGVNDKALASAGDGIPPQVRGFDETGSCLVFESGQLAEMGFSITGTAADRGIISYSLIDGSLHLLTHTAKVTSSASDGSITYLSQSSPTTYLSMSADGQWVIFSALDARQFGNNGVAFTDKNGTSATDLFATNVQSGEIRHLTAGVTTAATYNGLSPEGNTVLFSAANVNGVASLLGNVVDQNITGTDLMSVRLNLLDLATNCDTTGDLAGGAYDNVTASQNLTLSAIVKAGTDANLIDAFNGATSLVATATADARGNIAWNLNNVAPGVHQYSVYEPTQQIPYVIDKESPSASSLIVTVLSSGSQITLSSVDARDGITTAVLNWTNDEIPSIASGDKLVLTKNTDGNANTIDWHLASTSGVKLVDVVQNQVGGDTYNVSLWRASGTSVTRTVTSLDLISLPQFAQYKGDLKEVGQVVSEDGLVLSANTGDCHVTFPAGQLPSLTGLTVQVQELANGNLAVVGVAANGAVTPLVDIIPGSADSLNSLSCSVVLHLADGTTSTQQLVNVINLDLPQINGTAFKFSIAGIAGVATGSGQEQFVIASNQTNEIIDGGAGQDQLQESWAGRCLNVAPTSSAVFATITETANGVTLASGSNTVLQLQQNTAGINEYTLGMGAMQPTVTAVGGYNGAGGAVPNGLGEGWEKAVDGTTSSKFWTTPGTNAGIKFALTQATALNTLTITTANDVPDRDPMTFSVYGSNSNLAWGDANWVAIASNQPTNVSTNRFDTSVLGFANLNAYQYYKVVFPTPRTAGNGVQYAELALSADSTYATQILRNMETLTLDSQLGGIAFGVSSSGVSAITGSAYNDVINVTSASAGPVDAGAGIDNVVLNWANSDLPSIASGATMSIAKNTDSDAIRSDWHISIGSTQLLDVVQHQAGENIYDITLWKANGTSVTRTVTGAEAISLPQWLSYKSAVAADSSVVSGTDFTLRLKDAVNTANMSNVITTDTGIAAQILNGQSTRDNTLTLSGTADSGSTVQIFDGGLVLGAATMNGANWVFNTPTLAERAHTFRAVVTDSLGNSKTAQLVDASGAAMGQGVTDLTVQIRSYIQAPIDTLLTHSSTSLTASSQGAIAVVNKIGNTVVSTINDATGLGFTDGQAANADIVLMNSQSLSQNLVTHSSAAGHATSAGASGITYNGASADGSVIVFTDGTNAAAFGNNGTDFSDNNTAVADLMAYSASTGNLTLISHDKDGKAPNTAPTYRAVTADGSYVVFTSGTIGDYGNAGTAFTGSQTLLVGQVSNGSLRVVGHSASSLNAGSAATYVAVAADSQYVLFSAPNASTFGNNGAAFVDGDTSATDLLAYKLSDGTISLLSHASGSATNSGAGAMTYAGQSVDGKTIYVTTNDATKYGFTDVDTSKSDLIAIKVADGSMKMVSHSAANLTQGAGTNTSFIKEVGDYAYFWGEDATKLGPSGVSDDGASGKNLFRYNLNTQAVELLGKNASSKGFGNALSGNLIVDDNRMIVSDDGRYVAFSQSTSGVTGSFNLGGDSVFLFDAQTGSINLVNHSGNSGRTPSGYTSNGGYMNWGGASPKGFSADEQTLVFTSSFLYYYGAGFGYSGDYDQAVLGYDIATGGLRVLSHTANASNMVQGANANYLGMSADHNWVVFSSNDATKFGNNGVSFTDSNTTGTDLFATNVKTAEIKLLSGVNGASNGGTSSFVGFAEDGNTVLMKTSNVDGMKSGQDVTLTDGNPTGDDIVAVHMNLLDLATASDTSGAAAGTKYDNITASHNLTFTACLKPNTTVHLLDGLVDVGTATANAQGLATWNLTGVATGNHTYTLFDTTEQVRVMLDGNDAMSKLNVAVL